MAQGRALVGKGQAEEGLSTVLTADAATFLTGVFLTAAVLAAVTVFNTVFFTGAFFTVTVFLAAVFAGAATAFFTAVFFLAMAITFSFSVQIKIQQLFFLLLKTCKKT